jgi:hypothetical protein
MAKLLELLHSTRQYKMLEYKAQTVHSFMDGYGIKADRKIV